MRRAFAGAMVVGMFAACTKQATTLTLTVDAPVEPTSLSVRVYSAAGLYFERELPTVDLSRPARLVFPPETPRDVRVVVRGERSLGARAMLEGFSISLMPNIDTRVAVSLSSDKPDLDGDEVPDEIDDCVDVANQDQKNGAGFGPGDACFGIYALHPATVVVGDKLVIEGDIGSVATVRFAGGAEVEVRDSARGRMFVTVPASAQSGDVSVSTGARTSTALHLDVLPTAPGTDPTVAVDGPTVNPSRRGATVIRQRDYVYLIGGSQDQFGPADLLAPILRARISAGAVLGEFEALPEVSLTPARVGHASIVIGDKLYVIGGIRSGEGNATDSTLVAEISSDGATLGPLQEVAGLRLNHPRMFHSAVVLGNHLYVLYGRKGPAVTKESEVVQVERAVISPAGIGPFSDVEDSIVNFGPSALVVSGSYLHFIFEGGWIEVPVRDDGSFDINAYRIGPIGSELTAMGETVTFRLSALGLTPTVFQVGRAIFGYGAQIVAPFATKLCRADLSDRGSNEGIYAILSTSFDASPTYRIFSTALVLGASTYLLGGAPNFDNPIGGTQALRLTY